ncbi:MAG: hypothetical protein KAR40_11965 [Candidatus Sabulitectum sp.]|nr:hypothetical protein [Candidatus Sabulitectum sp.]
MLIVPATLNEAIILFANELSGEKPVRIQVEPRIDAGYSACGKNVTRAIAEEGGYALKGWRVWWIPDILIEAQAHVVWQSKDGTLRDVTPNSDNETECVFVLDPEMKENPGADFVPSRFKNLSGEPFVDRFILCTGIMAEHRDREYTSGSSLPAPPEAREFRPLLSQLSNLTKNRK